MVMKFVKPLYVIAVLFIAAAISLATCVRHDKDHKVELKKQQQIADNNYCAFTDSIKVLKNKENEEYYSKQAFIFENEQLKCQNIELSKVVIKYKEDLSQAAKATIIITDSINTEISILMNNRVQELQVNDSTLSMTFTATVTDTATVLSNLYYNIRLPLFVAFEHDAKRNHARVIFQSSPNVTFSNIEAYTVPYPALQRKKWFALGLHLGMGVGMANNKAILTPVLSVGMNFNPIQF